MMSGVIVSFNFSEVYFPSKLPTQLSNDICLDPCTSFKLKNPILIKTNHLKEKNVMLKLFDF